MSTRGSLLLFAVFTLGLGACDPPVDGGGEDLAAPPDLLPVPSGCPAPPVVQPQPVPPGYLPAQAVQLNYTVDGDTAHFLHPTLGDVDVRFLWVNTEESHGTRTTDFGIKTGQVMDGWLRAAGSIAVAFENDGTGQPKKDPYARLLALVFVDGELIQTRLVREGWSAYYTVFGCPPSPVHESLLYAEAEARANLRGIWTPGHPTDYAVVLADWTSGRGSCRPNPYLAPYCPK